MTDFQAQGTVLGTAAKGLSCPMCESGSLVTRHCKRVCEQCGYVESCEDNFIPNQANPQDH